MKDLCKLYVQMWRLGVDNDEGFIGFLFSLIVLVIAAVSFGQISLIIGFVATLVCVALFILMYMVGVNDE